jgi:uncharacterized protein
MFAAWSEKKASFFFYTTPIVLLNTIISLCISQSLLDNASNQDAIVLTDVLSFVAHYFALNLAVGLIAWVSSLALRPRLTTAVNVVLFLLFQVVLLVDVRIYSIFRFHINGLVLNVITTEGAGDSVVIGRDTLLSFAAAVLVVLLVELAINIFTGAYVKRLSAERRILIERMSKALLCIGVMLIVAEKGLYAYADIMNKTEITKTAKLYPLYQPFTVKGFARRVLHVDVNREEAFKVRKGGDAVSYPKKRLVFDSTRDMRYNIIVIVLEGARFDMLSEEVMPNVWKFGREHTMFMNHYSGGNATRFGVFSLFYGLPGTYWHTFLANRISPLLIDTFLEKGYDFKILSSTKLTFPELRKTVFLRLPDYIVDSHPTADFAERDRIISDTLIDYVSTRNEDRPFFAVLIYNASHQMYKYPPSFEKFRPVVPKELDYFKDVTPENIPKVRNRYKNSLYYDDYLIGRIIETLRKKKLLENSVVVITGDHGEEFEEKGFLGHNSSFNDYQTKTLFVMNYPGQGPRVVTRLTSHTDLVPTLMGSLGCTSPVEYYAQGVSLLNGDGNGRRYVTAASWDKAALINDEFVFSFTTELYNLSAIKVNRRGGFAPAATDETQHREMRGMLLDFAGQMAEFTR